MSYLFGLAPIIVDVISRIFEGHGLIGGGMREVHKYAMMQAQEEIDKILFDTYIKIL